MLDRLALSYYYIGVAVSQQINLEGIGGDNLKFSLKALRVNANLTQMDAAKKLNVSKPTIVNWENNNTSPTGAQLMKICAVYNCELSDIFLPDKLAES